MKYISFSVGTNVNDFFFLPTIRYNNDGCCKFLTIEWLNLYIGFTWE